MRNAKGADKKTRTKKTRTKKPNAERRDTKKKQEKEGLLIENAFNSHRGPKVLRLALLLLGGLGSKVNGLATHV
jgi:hypothetical protein